MKASSHGRGAEVRFVYEDKNLIVVDKPEGLPVIAPEGSRSRNLYDLVNAHLQKKNPRARAAVVHRIDRDTSGIVVFAKSAHEKKRLMDNWAELVLVRRYVAVIEGLVQESSGTIVSYLLENQGGTVYEVKVGTNGAQKAVMSWRLLAQGQGRSLLELELETGRKHQIRVQLAGKGHPVVGDERYGSRTNPLGRLCLHAACIELLVNAHGDALVAESPCPPEFRRLVDGDSFR